MRPPINRRHFLRSGLLGAAGLAAQDFAAWAGQAAAKSEVLDNGIILPSPWPPRLTALPRQPRVPGYLTTPPEVIPIDVGRQLFVDDFLVGHTTLTRTYHRAAYHPGNPVLTGGMVFSDGVFYDPRGRLFKMWYLRSEAKRAEADALGTALRADRRITAVRFVPREEAIKQLGAVEGLSDVIASLGRNPLPDAFVVTAASESLEPLAAELARLPGVAHVQADTVWARRLAALARIGRLGLGLLAALLGAGLVAVTFNTIRLQILTQRDEIEVSKLIGATDAFIRRPFYYLGLLQGIAGGAIALGIVAGVLALLNREVRLLAESYGSSFRFAFLSAGDACAVLALAGVLGWIGAHLSVSRHLRQIEPR